MEFPILNSKLKIYFASFFLGCLSTFWLSSNSLKSSKWTAKLGTLLGFQSTIPHWWITVIIMNVGFPKASGMKVSL